MIEEKKVTEGCRILMVEDVATDAELQLRELRQTGLSFESKIVETEAAFRREIELFEPDIILSDFSLPHFSGLAALAIARELRPEVPFIFVSGTIGEESAIDALKKGAIDYILKSNLKRFGPAVKRAITEVRERQVRVLTEERAEQRARQAENSFSLFMRHLPATAFTKDLEDRFVFVNQTFETLMGKSAGQLHGLTTRDLYPAELAEAILANDREVTQTRQTLRVVEKVKIGNEERHFLVNKFPILNEDKQVVMLGGISVDISDRVETERALALSEERFRGIVETTEEWIWEADADLRTTYNNPAAKRISGYETDELNAFTPRTLVYEPDQSEFSKVVDRAVHNRTAWSNFVLRLHNKDGSLRWLESSGMPLFAENGSLRGFRGTARDITHRKLQERKLGRLSR